MPLIMTSHYRQHSRKCSLDSAFYLVSVLWVLTFLRFFSLSGKCTYGYKKKSKKVSVLYADFLRFLFSLSGDLAATPRHTFSKSAFWSAFV